MCAAPALSAGEPSTRWEEFSIAKTIWQTKRGTVLMAEKTSRGNGLFTKVKERWDRFLAKPKVRKVLDSRIMHPSSWSLFPAVTGVCVIAIAVLCFAWRGWGLVKGIGVGQRINASLAVPGGLGAIVALTVAYRKQASTERNETQRQINAAVQLLGENHGAKRNAGVFALLDIGDRDSKVQQQIVDQLCRYLRTKRENDGSVESIILDELAWRLSAAFSSRWGHIHLDLRSAVITEPFIMQRCVIDSLYLYKTRFLNKFDISHTQIAKDASFIEAVFSMHAIFENTVFITPAWFARTQFLDTVSFLIAHFKEDAEFTGATFKGDVDLTCTDFSKDANFSGSTIYGEFPVTAATFNGDVTAVNVHYQNPRAKSDMNHILMKQRTENQP